MQSALRAFYAALSRKDWADAVKDLPPDFALKTPAQGLEAGTVVGPDRIARAFEDFFGPYEEVTVEPEEVFERGDRIVVFFLQRARPRDSSSAVEVRAAHLWTMRAGEPSRVEIFPDREQALRAAGITDSRESL